MTWSLTAHLATCGRCAKVIADLQLFRDLGRHLPTVSPTQARLEQTRTAMLAAKAARSQRGSEGPGKSARKFLGFVGGRSTIVATALAAVVVVAIVGWRRPSGRGDATSFGSLAAGAVFGTFHATVYPRPGARLDRSGNQTDDIVRLREGGARFEVSPLGPGERFRVVAGDGEVEVRGTSFEVDVRVDHLSAVRVQHGRVEVRVAGRPAVVLGPRDDWNAAEPVTPAQGAGATAAEKAFVAGWTAFRAGHFSDSIASFDQMLHLAPDSAMAEDAEYWRAIAFARAGSPVAADQLRAFLIKYPRSAHTDDAMVALTRCERQSQ
jgi:ferric-dicitrate binding protein FerR (iron transport regulator)